MTGNCPSQKWSNTGKPLGWVSVIQPGRFRFQPGRLKDRARGSLCPSRARPRPRSRFDKNSRGRCSVSIPLPARGVPGNNPRNLGFDMGVLKQPILFSQRSFQQPFAISPGLWWFSRKIRIPGFRMELEVTPGNMYFQESLASASKFGSPPPTQTGGGCGFRRVSRTCRKQALRALGIERIFTKQLGPPKSGTMSLRCLPLVSQHLERPFLPTRAKHDHMQVASQWLRL